MVLYSIKIRPKATVSLDEIYYYSGILLCTAYQPSQERKGKLPSCHPNAQICLDKPPRRSPEPENDPDIAHQPTSRQDEEVFVSPAKLPHSFQDTKLRSCDVFNGRRVYHRRFWFSLSINLSCMLRLPHISSKQGHHSELKHGSDRLHQEEDAHVGDEGAERIPSRTQRRQTENVEEGADDKRRD